MGFLPFTFLFFLAITDCLPISTQRGLAMEKRFIVKADDLLTAFLSLEKDAIVPKDANANATPRIVA